MLVTNVPLEIPISIHTLRVEGDNSAELLDWYINISIHTLRVEGDTSHSKACPIV